jgi:predicted nucleic acid-binding protein
MNASRVFVDANILVYAQQPNETAKQPVALACIDRLGSEGRGRTSVQALNECYSALTHKLRPQIPRPAAWSYVSKFHDWGPLPVDVEMAKRAKEVQERYGLNWWDCLIVAAAQMQNCEVLLTEDLSEQGDYGGVKVCNPFRLAMCSEESPLAEFAAFAAALTWQQVGQIHPAPSTPRQRRISPSRPRGTCVPWARSGSGGIH